MLQLVQGGRCYCELSGSLGCLRMLHDTAGEVPAVMNSGGDGMLRVSYEKARWVHKGFHYVVGTCLYRRPHRLGLRTVVPQLESSLQRDAAFRHRDHPRRACCLDAHCGSSHSPACFGLQEQRILVCPSCSLVATAKAHSFTMPVQRDSAAWNLPWLLWCSRRFLQASGFVFGLGRDGPLSRQA